EGDMATVCAGKRLTILRRRLLRLTGCPAEVRPTSTGGSYVQAQIPSAEPGSRGLADHAVPRARRYGCRRQHREALGQEGGYEADQETRADSQRQARQ